MKKKSKKNIRSWRPLGIGLVITASFFLTGLVAADDEGPKIYGTITILDRDGNPKSDQSGAVVFLDDLENPLEENPAPPEKVSIHQAGKRFLPKVLPIVAGTTVDFPNDDTVFHNVFSLSKAKPFDLGLYPQETNKSVTFEKTGLVKIYCNIHPQMVAYILVLANRHFTVTDPNGRFVLADVPPGAATVRTWYPQAKENPQYQIRITPEGVRDINMTIIENLQLRIQEENITVQHKNKFGQQYPAKY